MDVNVKILMLEDSNTDAEIIRRMVEMEFAGCQVLLAMNREGFLQALAEFAPTVILADNSLPQFDAAEALDIVRQRGLHIPLILVTGSVSEEFAAAIIKSGADDYILKDRLIRLPSAIRAAIHKHETEKARQAAFAEIKRSNERFLILSRATKDAIWDWDLLTGEVWWNENLFNILAFEVSGHVPDMIELTDRIHPRDRAKVLSRLEQIRTNNLSSWEDEFRFEQQDGSYGTVLDRGYILKDEQDLPVRAIGAMVDISEQKRLMKEMEEERIASKIERQKEINRVMLQTQEMERNALGRELHDNINQILVSINLRLGYFLDEPEGNLQIVFHCRQTLEVAIAEARNLSHQMVVPRFSEKNLKDELELLIGNYTFSNKIQVDMDQFSEEKIPFAVKESLFRIVQEQLSNIAKHSGASRIDLRLFNDPTILGMDIRDDGIGFDLQQRRRGIGLANILNRAESYNGTATITTEPGKGCWLSVRIPLCVATN